MKLTTRDIPGFLKSRPQMAVVLIYGPDHGLVKERGNILGKFVVADLNDAFNTATFTPEQMLADPAAFLDETRAISMLGGDRLIRVVDASDGITTVLKSYLDAPSAGTLVIITADELGPKSALRKLCETHAQAVALPCYVQEAGELSRVIADMIRAANLRIEPDALNFLASAIAGDHQQVRSEIQKLLTYMGVNADGMGNGATVTYDDVVACSGAMGLANLDHFIDALLLGDTAQAFALLTRLEDDGVAPIAMLRALLAHGRKLHGVHIRLNAGERLDEILDGRDAPVFFKRKSAFGAQLRKWPMPALQKMMHDVLGCEARLKSGTDPDVSIPQTLLSLATRAGKQRA